jgi:hypothetical protein
LFSVIAAGALEYGGRRSNPRPGNPLLLAAMFFVICMAGLRYQVGADWINYLRIYEDFRYANLGWTLGSSDPGYSLLNWIAHRLGFGIWFVNLVCAAVFGWGLWAFANRQPNPWLGILVAIPYLIIVVVMGYTRQGVAVGLVLAGLAALDRGSMARFLVYLCIAVAFHKSAIVVIPIVALAAATNRILLLPLVIVLTLVLYDAFVADAIEKMVNNYSTYESQGAAIRVAMNVPPAILYLLFYHRFDLKPEQLKLWRNFSLAALLAPLGLVFASGSTAVDRLALYLIPLQLFVLSRLPHAFGENGRPNGQLTLVLIIYSALIQFVWLKFSLHAQFWVPYQFYPTATIE